MINKLFFRFFYLLKFPKVIHFEQKLKEIDNREEYLDEKLVDIYKYAFNNIPFYNKLYKEKGLTIDSIKGVKDLNKLPIIDKMLIKNNIHDFVDLGDRSYRVGSTGGSTGEPLKYRIDVAAAAVNVNLLYNGWALGGYERGDRVLVFGGGSIASNARKNIKNSIASRLLNIYSYSTKSITNTDLNYFATEIQNKKPKFIRGYPSSILMIVNYLEENKKLISFQNLKAIFVTGEMLYEKDRKKIEEFFNVKVYNQYGLNDGGVTAFECSENKGLHIDFERAILEIDSEKNNQSGEILATDLYNFSMPFIRYRTGDLAKMSTLQCSCGTHKKLISELQGRSNDVLTINNISIASPGLNSIFSKFDIVNFRINQIGKNKIIIFLLKGLCFNKANYLEIKKEFENVFGEFTIEFDTLTPEMINSKNKHKFIEVIDGEKE